MFEAGLVMISLGKKGRYHQYSIGCSLQYQAHFYECNSVG
jgi:hypothetical protein